MVQRQSPFPDGGVGTSILYPLHLILGPPSLFWPHPASGGDGSDCPLPLFSFIDSWNHPVFFLAWDNVALWVLRWPGSVYQGPRSFVFHVHFFLSNYSVPCIGEELLAKQIWGYILAEEMKLHQRIIQMQPQWLITEIATIYQWTVMHVSGILPILVFTALLRYNWHTIKCAYSRVQFDNFDTCLKPSPQLV